MTVIVGLIDDEEKKIYMGSDRAGTDGRGRQGLRKDPKVFIRGDFIFGCSGSFRMRDLLAYNKFELPKYDGEHSIFYYMHNNFIDEVIKVFKDNNYANLKDNEISGESFLVGWRGHLFYIGSDFQIGENVDGYECIGSGYKYALGSLATTKDMSLNAHDRVLKAIMVSNKFDTGCNGVANIESVNYD
jgi:ATP-dependent protease HslVU (ClpYQ) peptidase subunit